ncbi:unnamed protein product, partial [Brassica napus]
NDHFRTLVPCERLQALRYHRCRYSGAERRRLGLRISAV